MVKEWIIAYLFAILHMNSKMNNLAMSRWNPIPLSSLLHQIEQSEAELDRELISFWKLIRIKPEKWSEKDFGVEGGGFWVVAICGKKVIWYNDIEEGFNISLYTKYGEIDEYLCDQDELHFSLRNLFAAGKSW